MKENQDHRVAIRFTEVYFSYGNFEVLNNVSFHIHEGEFVSIVGPNGMGKTTILKLMLGLLTPTRGRIEIFGKEPKYNLIKTGYIPQNINAEQNFPITVEEVIKTGLLRGFSPVKSDLKWLDEALELLDIKDLRKRQYSSLSGGQKRRVLLARALVSKPEILFLDEPTANIDVESEKKLFDVLAHLKKKTTILIVTHDTEFVSGLTDVVLCISKKHYLVRHAVEPVPSRISDLYSGEVLRVLHNTDLPDDFNCCKNLRRE
ncbi:MAG: metal ABC transporter ATP-binding protein [Brevinematia bacterium]